MTINPKIRRIIWTSGNGVLDALNTVGDTRPWCNDPRTAHDLAGRRSGEMDSALYRIVVEEYPLDTDVVEDHYIRTIEACTESEQS